MVETVVVKEGPEGVVGANRIMEKVGMKMSYMYQAILKMPQGGKPKAR